MKKLKFIALLLCAFSLVAYCGCSKDDDEPTTGRHENNGDPGGTPDPDPEPTLEEMVTGTWQGEYDATLGKLEFTITFNSDHTGTVSVFVLSMPISGGLTWNVDQEERTLTATLNIPLLSDNGIVGNIVSIDETTMVVNATILRQVSEVTLTRLSEE